MLHIPYQTFKSLNKLNLVAVSSRSLIESRTNHPCIKFHSFKRVESFFVIKIEINKLIHILRHSKHKNRIM